MTTSSNVSASKRSNSSSFGVHGPDLLAAEGGEGVDEQLVLGGVDAGGERLERVVGVDRHGREASTGPSSTASSGTRWTITPVTRALAGQRLLPRPLDGVGAGQLAGQRRVEVDDPVGEPAEEAHRQDAHPAGEHDEVGAEAGDDVGEPGVVVGRAPRRGGGRRGRRGPRPMPARARAWASARSETTATTSAGRRPSAQASRIACRLVPLPEASTTSRVVRGIGTSMVRR